MHPGLTEVFYLSWLWKLLTAWYDWHSEFQPSQMFCWAECFFELERSFYTFGARTCKLASSQHKLRQNTFLDHPVKNERVGRPALDVFRGHAGVAFPNKLGELKYDVVLNVATSHDSRSQDLLGSNPRVQSGWQNTVPDEDGMLSFRRIHQLFYASLKHCGIP